MLSRFGLNNNYLSVISSRLKKIIYVVYDIQGIMYSEKEVALAHDTTLRNTRFQLSYIMPQFPKLLHLVI